MKKISLLFGFAALSISASFASGSLNKTKFNALKKHALVKTSCTVRVQTGGYDVTITNTCTCTSKAACDGAYAVATLLLK